MLESEGAKKAIQDPNPVIDGRKANVNLAYIGAKPRGVSTGMKTHDGLTPNICLSYKLVICRQTFILI